MHADNLVVNQRRNGHAVEHVLELLPQADVVSALALVVEAVDAVNLATLVVAAQQEEVLLVLALVGQQQNDRFQGLLSAVHVIPQEEVVGFRRESTVLEQAQQVSELSVHVT